MSDNTTPAIEPAREHLLKASDALVRCIAIAGGTEPSYALVAEWLYRMADKTTRPETTGNCPRVGSQIEHPCPTCGATAASVCRLTTWLKR
jgi:hypothetical protein